MTMLDMRFYLDVAKFGFALVGGASAGYFAAKGFNSAASKVATIAEMQMASRMMGAGGDESLDVTGDDDDFPV